MGCLERGSGQTRENRDDSAPFWREKEYFVTGRLPISRTVILIEALVEPTVRWRLRVAALFGHSRLFKDRLAKYMTLSHKLEGSCSLQDICYGRADRTRGPQQESVVLVALLSDVSGCADVQALLVNLSQIRPTSKCSWQRTDLCIP